MECSHHIPIISPFAVVHPVVFFPACGSLHQRGVSAISSWVHCREIVAKFRQRWNSESCRPGDQRVDQWDFQWIFQGMLMRFHGFQWIFMGFSGLGKPTNIDIQWIELVGKSYGKQWFLPSLKRVSCKFPLRPILGNGEIVGKSWNICDYHAPIDRERERVLLHLIWVICVYLEYVYIYNIYILYVCAVSVMISKLNDKLDVRSFVMLFPTKQWQFMTCELEIMRRFEVPLNC